MPRLGVRKSANCFAQEVLYFSVIYLTSVGDLAVAFEQGDGSEEEDAGGEGEQDDGVAIGGLGFGRGGGGVVAALGAALRVGWRGEKKQEEGCREEQGFSGACDRLRAAR